MTNCVSQLEFPWISPSVEDPMSTEYRVKQSKTVALTEANTWLIAMLLHLLYPPPAPPIQQALYPAAHGNIHASLG